jgi:hypothetical protein
MKEKKKRLSKLAIQKHAVEDVGSLRYAMLKREFTGRRSKLLEFEDEGKTNGLKSREKVSAQL